MFIILLLLIPILLVIYYHYKENVDMPLIENALLPVTGGTEFIDPEIRVLDPRKVRDPAYTRTAYEVRSWPIISTTPESIYRQVFGY